MIRDTLIIIDDSELDLAILNEIFKGLFQVECFSEARRGLTYLHHNSQRVCAVLLDICLEDLTGQLQKQVGVPILSYDLKLLYLCEECQKKQQKKGK